MDSNLTLAIIGCGNMGSAILSGILDASTTTECPFSRIIACTKSKVSAETLGSRYHGHASTVGLEFQADANFRAASAADVVILGCKPYLVDDVLKEHNFADMLARKLVISIIAGKTIDVLAKTITENQGEFTRYTSKETTIARAIPNMAAGIRQSMTILETPPTLSTSQKDLVHWTFSQIGHVKTIDPSLFDLGSMLMASIATISVAVDGILDGCVAEGMKRSDANEMTAQCLLGLGGLLKEGQHPAVLRESISSPRGCTIQGLLAVERGGVRSAFAESIIAGTEHLRGLQKEGKKE